MVVRDSNSIQSRAGLADLYRDGPSTVFFKMGNYAANTTLWELLGAVDNFSEPKPMWNERSTIWGIVLTFTVHIIYYCRTTLSLKLTFWQLTSIICIFFRLYARVFIAKCAGWDDVFVVLFMVSIYPMETPQRLGLTTL